MLLSNYLFFTDACEEALRFYEACGLGRIVEMVRYGADSMPPKSEAMRGRAQDELFCQLRHGQARALIVTEVISGSGFAPASRLVAA